MSTGSGPSALIISYILHGYKPVYNVSSPHQDHLLHEKLSATTDLFGLDVEYVTEHFNASRMSYSTQALPVNVLLDTLIRPFGETDDAEDKTCIEWVYDPTSAVPHIVVGNTSQTGGQWVDRSSEATLGIGTLSYAGMLSLPGYSFADFHQERYGKQLPFYVRPPRNDVTEYFASYPAKVGIQDAVHSGIELFGISRTGSGFHIASHDITCKHLVLATGTFTTSIPPRPLLQPLTTLSTTTHDAKERPLLVIGSGFSAADVIMSTPPSREIIHIYKWAPSKTPSPLRACHQDAYPEYAGVYRKMKMAALSSSSSSGSKGRRGSRPTTRRISSSGPNTVDLCRNWEQSYEGLPNTHIIDVEVDPDGFSSTVTFQNSSGDVFQRQVGGLAYCVGRRGSLNYLDAELQQEVCPTYDSTMGVSGRDMRDAANEDLEVAENAFIIGSLTGDTLIRFAYGGCVYAAGKIISRRQEYQAKTPVMTDGPDTNEIATDSDNIDDDDDDDQRSDEDRADNNSDICTPDTSQCSTPSRRATAVSQKGSGYRSGTSSPGRGVGIYVQSMEGLDGHQVGLGIGI